MREVISVHVGQAGVQIGNACCELSFHSRPPAVAVRVDPCDRRVVLSFGMHVCFVCGDTEAQCFPPAGELYTVEHGLGVSSLLPILLHR